MEREDGSDDDALTPAVIQAVQVAHGLELTGVLDDATRAVLEDRHGY